MASEWRAATVSELQREGILLVEDGNHGESRPRPTEFVDGGVAFIRAADMVDGRVLFQSASTIDSTARKRIVKGIGAPHDVLLSHKGTVGKVAFVPSDAPPFVCSPQTTFWRALDIERLEPRYLHAYLRSPLFTTQLNARSGETDMAPYVSLTSQRGLSVVVPPISEQRAIAHILGTLDDKIELNRQMSATLEAMARALFESWFVRFDPVRAKAEGRDTGLPADIATLFPDSFEQSEIGEVPKGWRTTAFADLLSVAIGGAWGDDAPSSSSDVAVCCLRGIDCATFADLSIPSPPTRWITPRALEQRQPLQGDLLIEGSGSFCGRSLWWDSRYDAMLPNRVVYSNFCKRLTCKSDALSLWVWMWLRRIYRDGGISAFRTGTAFPNLDVSGMLTSTVQAEPPKELLDAFRRFYLLGNRVDLLQNTQALTELRDTLLPKLISGELRIPDAERFLADAGVS